MFSASARENVEKLEHCTLPVGMQKRAAAVRWDDRTSSMKTRITYKSAFVLLGTCSKGLKTESQREICTPMPIAASFTIAQLWKQFR